MQRGDGMPDTAAAEAEAALLVSGGWEFYNPEGISSPGYEKEMGGKTYHAYSNGTFGKWGNIFFASCVRPMEERSPYPYKSLAEAQAACEHHHLTGKWHG
jgi:hypothetical protein